MAKKKSSGDKSSPAPPSSEKRSVLASASPLQKTSPKVPRKVVSPHEGDIRQYENTGLVADPMRAAEVPRSQKLSWLARLREALGGTMSSTNVVVPVKHPTTVLVQEKSASESLEEAIEAIAQKLSALPPDKLLAGLSVLVRDLDTIKGELQPREAAFFADTFEPIIAEERRDHRGNTIFIADKSNLPSGMASDYAKGKRGRNGLTSQLQLNGIEEVLSSDAIVNERTTATGERILGKFMRKCKDVICGKGGPYERFVKKSAGQKALEGQIGAAILGMGIAASSPLVPLGACCAVLLVKTGLKTLCEP